MVEYLEGKYSNEEGGDGKRRHHKGLDRFGILGIMEKKWIKKGGNVWDITK